MWSAIADA